MDAKDDVYVAAPSARTVKQGVKRTQKAAPPHHAVAPDSAKIRSQVNRVVLFPVFVLTKTTLLFIFYDEEKQSMYARGYSNTSLKGARYVRYI